MISSLWNWSAVCIIKYCSLISIYKYWWVLAEIAFMDDTNYTVYMGFQFDKSFVWKHLRKISFDILVINTFYWYFHDFSMNNYVRRCAYLHCIRACVSVCVRSCKLVPLYFSVVILPLTCHRYFVSCFIIARIWKIGWAIVLTQLLES